MQETAHLLCDEVLVHKSQRVQAETPGKKQPDKMVIPITQAAKDWVNENVGLEMWQWTPTEHGMGFGVEWRYYDQLIEGMENDGLIPGYDFNAVA